jgi:hypothetical protein
MRNKTPRRRSAARRSTRIRRCRFSQEEMLAILASATKKIAEVRTHGKNRACRPQVLVLFLRYTGLRISDAIGCAAGRLRDGKLFP